MLYIVFARDPTISAQPFGSRSKAKVLRGLAPRHPEPAGGSGATAGTTGGAGGAGDAGGAGGAGGAGLQRSSSRLSQAPTEVERRPSTSLSQAETLVDDERHDDIFEPRPPKPVRFAYNTQ